MSLSSRPPLAGDRPRFGIVSGILTPYRLHLHRRLTREIPELELISFFTHGRDEGRWDMGDVEEINPVWLSDLVREHSDDAGHMRFWRREYARGGALIEQLQQYGVRALIINGYNDMTRVRVIRWCKGRGIPTFVRGDSNILGDRPGSATKAWLKRRVLGSVLRASNGAMPMGQLGQAYFERYGVEADRCFWVPCEPDYERFASAPDESVELLRSSCGLDSSKRYLVFVGRLVEVKRLDLLLDAFATIAAERPGWDVLVAGDGPLAGDLQSRVPEVIADRVAWLGFLDVEQLRAAYQLADVLVLPSEYEPWALVVNEAMAAGCVVVASDVVGAARELVEDGVSGRVFASGDLDDLIDVLRDVTDSNNYDNYQRGVGPSLAAWRDRADPVAGVRDALDSVGVLG